VLTEWDWLHFIVSGVKFLNREVLVLFPAAAIEFFLIQAKQIGYGACRFYYAMSIGGKVAGV
jgi:hypothetical protein